jgi:hypothetical protein
MCSACRLSYCEDASGMMMVAACVDQPIRKPIRLCRWVREQCYCAHALCMAISHTQCDLSAGGGGGGGCHLSRVRIDCRD